MFSLVILILTTITLGIGANQQTVYPVIIIGAGAAGIGASVSLTSLSISHIILEARDRLGGRIKTTDFDGTPFDLGASFVHNPNIGNSVDTYMKLLNLATTAANPANAFFLQQAELSQADIITANAVYGNLVVFILEKLTDYGDVSLQVCWDEFRSIAAAGYSAAILNYVAYRLELEGRLSGAELSQLSALYFSQNTETDSADYLPTLGYSHFLSRVHQTYCSNSQILYNQVVKTIDYSAAIVRITTQAGTVYQAKKVISSLPLGVLQGGTVDFLPALPTAHLNAIGNIGFGVFNKVVVESSQKFWRDTDSKLDFVRQQGEPNTFPEAYVVRHPSKNVLMFFVTGEASLALGSMSDAGILANLTASVQKFSPAASTIFTSPVVTRWEVDPYSLGSYSYFKVGTTKADFAALSVPISNRLWLVGEHTHPTQSSNVHGAFESGMLAGKAAGEVWVRLAEVSVMVLLALAAL